MKITELAKDYRLYIAKKLNSPDEVFTSTELFHDYQEDTKDVTCNFSTFRHYVSDHYSNVNIGSLKYYGGANALAKAKKAIAKALAEAKKVTGYRCKDVIHE